MIIYQKWKIGKLEGCMLSFTLNDEDLRGIRNLLKSHKEGKPKIKDMWILPLLKKEICKK
jgi:hypothetical protein